MAKLETSRDGQKTILLLFQFTPSILSYNVSNMPVLRHSRQTPTRTGENLNDVNTGAELPEGQSPTTQHHFIHTASEQKGASNVQRKLTPEVFC